MANRAPVEKTRIGGGITIFLRQLQSGGVYYARFKLSDYRLSNGRRYLTESMKTSSFEEAKEAAIARYVEVQSLERMGRTVRSETVASEIARFIRDYEQKLEAGHQRFSKHMLRAFEKTVVRYFSEFAGTQKLQDINKDTLAAYEGWRRRYWKDRKEKKLKVHSNARMAPSARTLQWEINAIKQFLRWAQDEGRYSNNALRFSFRPDTKESRSAFTPEQWDRIMKVVDKVGWIVGGKHNNDKRFERYRLMLRAYVKFMGRTGLRPGEARFLRWENIQFFEEDKRHSDGVEIHIAAARSKTKRIRRVVADGDAANAIFELKMSRLQRGEECKPKDFIWCDVNGRVINDFREGFNVLLKKADAEYDQDGKKLTIYSLRHTYITGELRAGTNVHEIAFNCGTSVEMIESYYRHLKGPEFRATFAPKRTVPSAYTTRKLEWDVKDMLEQINQLPVGKRRRAKASS